MEIHIPWSVGFINNWFAAAWSASVVSIIFTRRPDPCWQQEKEKEN